MGRRHATVLAAFLGTIGLAFIASAQESPPVPEPDSLPETAPADPPVLDPGTPAPTVAGIPSATGAPAEGADLSSPPAGVESPADSEPGTPSDPTAPPPLPSVPSRSRAAVRQAAVAIRSFTPDETMARAVEALEALGAYIQESRTGQASLRVPADRLDAAVEALRGIGEIVREDRSLEDVTLEIGTLQARIRELDLSRRRIQGMLALAATVTDTLAVERNLQQVTEDLEAQQGRLRYLIDRVELAPFELEVSMKARPAPVRPVTRPPFPWVREYGLEALLSRGRDGEVE